MRYNLLEEQFHVEHSPFFNNEIKDSIERIFSFIYHQTDIYYLDCIDSSTLYQYIQYHLSVSIENRSFIKIIKDVKNYLYFIEKLKKANKVPNIDLSLKNIALWETMKRV